MVFEGSVYILPLSMKMLFWGLTDLSVHGKGTARLEMYKVKITPVCSVLS